MPWMNCIFNVSQNLVAFHPQIKTAGLNEILCVFRNPGAMYYVHKNCLYDQANRIGPWRAPGKFLGIGSNSWLNKSSPRFCVRHKLEKA